MFYPVAMAVIHKGMEVHGMEQGALLSKGSGYP
jgi:hypothetical protein